MSISPGLIAWKLSFQISPIILTGGLAGAIPGGMLPIIILTEAADFVTGLLSGGAPDDDLDQYFAHYYPAAGGKLISNMIGKYPFANQQVAGNAVIVNPNTVSLIMECPAKGDNAYALKFATITALQSAIKNHVNMGGTFTVMTPAFPYINGVLLGLTDVSNTGPRQPQSRFQWDFEFPLLTQSQAAAAMNSMMDKLSSGLPSTGATSGTDLTVGSTNSLATGAVSPAASNTAGTSLAGQLAGGTIPL